MNERTEPITPRGQIDAAQLRRLASQAAAAPPYCDRGDFYRSGTGAIVAPLAGGAASLGTVGATGSPTWYDASGGLELQGSTFQVTPDPSTGNPVIDLNPNLELTTDWLWDLEGNAWTIQSTPAGDTVNVGGMGTPATGTVQPLVLTVPFEICGVQLWCCYTVTPWEEDQTDWYVVNPATVYRVSTPSPLTNVSLESISPFTLNGVRQPQFIVLVNVPQPDGTVGGTITLVNEAGPSVAHQLVLPNGNNVELGVNEAALLWYDYCQDQLTGAGCWRLLAATACLCPPSGLTSLGIQGESVTYTGAVKLEAGSGVTLTDDPDNNAIIISSTAGGGSSTINVAKLTVSYTDVAFTRTGNTQTFTVVTLPAQSVVRHVYYTNGVWTNSLGGNMGLQVQNSLSTIYTSGIPLFSASSGADALNSSGSMTEHYENFGTVTGTSVSISVTDAGGQSLGNGATTNLTGGTLTVWVEYDVLP